MQVHGPVTKDFAISKLGKHKFKKGSFLLRQSTLFLPPLPELFPCLSSLCSLLLNLSLS